MHITKHLQCCSPVITTQQQGSLPASLPASSLFTVPSPTRSRAFMTRNLQRRRVSLLPQAPRNMHAATRLMSPCCPWTQVLPARCDLVTPMRVRLAQLGRACPAGICASCWAERARARVVIARESVHPPACNRAEHRWGRHGHEHLMYEVEGAQVRGGRRLSASVATTSIARTTLRTSSARTHVGATMLFARHGVAPRSWGAP